MAKKKQFETLDFSEYDGAVYEMRRLLIEIKAIFRTTKNYQHAKKMVVEKYGISMEEALRKALFHGTEWMCEINEDSVL